MEVIEFDGEGSSVTVSSQMAMRNNLACVNYSMRSVKDALWMEQAASHSHCSIDLSVLLGIEFQRQQDR